MALALGGTFYGSDPPPLACSCLLPAPNQAGHILFTLPGIADVGNRCMSPRFPPCATLLCRPQLRVAEVDCASQVVSRFQLGRGETCVGLGSILLWWENQCRKYMVIKPW